MLLTAETYPRIQVVFGGHDAFRESLIIEASDFVGVKSYKAKGKRLTTYTVAEINELEPTRMPEPEETPDTEESGTPEDENGQMNLFDSEEQ